MIINQKVLLCGETGGLDNIIKLMKADKCRYIHFVYTTGSSDSVLSIGDFNMLKKEKQTPVICGIATTHALAKKIVMHIIEKSVLLDSDIKIGIEKYLKM